MSSYVCNYMENEVKDTRIIIDGVSKCFKNGCVALRDINLEIKPGIFGLIGKNGAGKTTLMKCICTIYKPSEGDIIIFGNDVLRDGSEIRKNIGYLPQEFELYNHLSVEAMLEYLAGIKGIYDKAKVLHAIEMVGLNDKRKCKIKELSGGMKRRVGIAQAIIGEPQLLIVDEPTAGLDPDERVRFRNVLLDYASRGKTVILSTHIVEDIAATCEDIALLDKGKVKYSGRLENMIKKVQNKIYEKRMRTQEELEHFKKVYKVLSTSYSEKGIRVKYTGETLDGTERLSTDISLEDAVVYFLGGALTNE